MSFLESGIESLIFCSPKPIKVEEIIKVFAENNNKNYDDKKIKKTLSLLINKYKDASYPFEIIESR